MAKKKIISIIILSWNTKKLLRQCLKSVVSDQWLVTRKKKPTTNHQLPTTEIIVVDNASTDGSPEMVEEMVTSTLHLIKNKKNLGYGAGNNQGMRKAKGDYFLLLNSDTLVKNKAPVKMAQFLGQHPEVGAIGCKLLNQDGSDQPSFGLFPNLLVTLVMLFAEHWLGESFVRRSGDKVKETDWVMGAALMVKREAAEKAGPMDEGIFMYMDEVEWCRRIKKSGYRVMFYPGAEITHLGRGSSKTGRKDPILNIYRGLIYFYKKHYPRWQLPILRLMLKLKAAGTLLLGYLTNNQYLKETYGQALKIS
ncbi:glycosyltransferase family 2 protein [Patescibacteria group bacterium]|nr:glycosyltransferase family 2 protein [Patescibacteria group bacterium]